MSIYGNYLFLNKKQNLTESESGRVPTEFSIEGINIFAILDNEMVLDNLKKRTTYC